MNDLSPSEQERLKRLGERIASARRNRSLTLVQLAERARLDERTVRTAITGEYVRPGSLKAICDALEIDVDEDDEKIYLADERFGSYLLDHYKEYVGHYYCYRRSFTFPLHILRSVYEIRWCADKDNEGLKFREIQKYDSINFRKKIDFSQDGDVYISNSTNMVHFITSNRGAIRLVTLTKMQCDDGTENGTLSGIVLTQAKKSGYHQPSTSAIFFQKLENGKPEEELTINVGAITPEYEDYQYLNDVLIDIEKNVGIFAVTQEKVTPDLRIVSSQA